MLKIDPVIIYYIAQGKAANGARQYDRVALQLENLSLGHMTDLPMEA